jgi:transcriptional regulator with XRE-family HTH domain
VGGEGADRVNLGYLVRSLRAQRGITQDRLAEICRTSRQHINTIEQGHRWNLKIEMVAQLAEGLKIDPGIVAKSAITSMQESRSTTTLNGPQDDDCL